MFVVLASGIEIGLDFEYRKEYETCTHITSLLIVSIIIITIIVMITLPPLHSRYITTLMAFMIIIIKMTE